MTTLTISVCLDGQYGRSSDLRDERTGVTLTPSGSDKVKVSFISTNEAVESVTRVVSLPAGILRAIDDCLEASRLDVKKQERNEAAAHNLRRLVDDEVAVPKGRWSKDHLYVQRRYPDRRVGVAMVEMTIGESASEIRFHLDAGKDRIEEIGRLFLALDRARLGFALDAGGSDEA